MLAAAALLVASPTAEAASRLKGAPRHRSPDATYVAPTGPVSYPSNGYQTPTYTDAGYGGDNGVVKVDLSGAQGVARTLALPRGKSAVIDLPTDARDVLVSDPKVADVVLSTPRRIFIMGVAGGQTDAAFFDGAGRQLLRLNIRVDQDSSALADTLNRILPGAKIRVDAVNDSLVLSGEAASAADADKAIRLAQGFVAKPEQVVNMIAVGESDQVMLKVRIIEVNRNIIKQLGTDLGAILGQAGLTQFNLSKAATYGVSGSLLGGITGGYAINTTTQPQVKLYDSLTNAYDIPAVDHNSAVATTQTTSGSKGLNKANGTLQAFERVGLVRTLAEPNLTAVSGQAGKFLVGGEFPVPVGQDTTGKVTVEFKPYGVGLGFTPVVMSKGRISLKLSTEVSELTNTGGFTLSAGGGSGSSGTSLSVPGLNVRRVETTVELPSGQALMIAGLLQNVSKETLDSLPGLMNVPVLGSLFRSRDYLNNETELVIIVTPYLVRPVRPDQLQTPADGLEIASDLETNLMGRMNKTLAKKPAAVAGRTYQGPIGYVVE